MRQVVEWDGGWHPLPTTPVTCRYSPHDLPRTLDGVLDDTHRKQLVRVYMNRIHRLRVKPTYYNLLRALVETDDEEDYARSLAAFDAVRHVVQSSFGDGFIIINDFYSYRAAKRKVLFPGWHQDYDFWITGDTCNANFNLWVLLDHREMNYTFDLYETVRNPQLYKQLYRNSSATQHGMLPVRFYQAMDTEPESFFRAHGVQHALRSSARSDLSAPAISRLPLRLGAVRR